MAYIFEIHLTVDSLTKERLPSFEQFCQTLGGQAVLIQLPVGEHTQQPMFTMTEKGENLAEILAFIDDLKPRFVAENFSIIRTKLEIPAHQANEFLSQYPDTNGYFEWHGKVDFVGLKNLPTLQVLAKNHQVHLSQNSLKNLPNQRFITLRYQLAQQEDFYQKIADITQTIQQYPHFSLLRSQAEYCVFDSNISLDTGWL